MADPNAWKKYLKSNTSRGTGLSGGLSFGSDDNGLATADFLSKNFDDLGGGGGLTPQDELRVTQETIRGGAALSSPETNVTRFATAIKDNQGNTVGNYLDPAPPKPAEIPPYLARNISPDMISPRPVAQPATGVISPELLVQRQNNPDGTRGSNVANAPPIRANFMKREAMAKMLEDRAAKSLNSGWASVFPGHTNQQVQQDLMLAKSMRSLDSEDYNAATNQYYISNPDKFNEWQRRAVIQQGKPQRFQPTIATQRGTNDVMAIGDAGIPLAFPGTSETQLVSNEQIAARQKELAEAKAREEAKDRDLKLKEIESNERRTGMMAGAQNRATDVRENKGDTPKRATPSQLNAALKQGKPGTPKYDAALQQMGLVKHDDGSWWTSGAASAGAQDSGAGSAAAPNVTSKFAITKRK